MFRPRWLLGAFVSASAFAQTVEYGIKPAKFTLPAGMEPSSSRIAAGHLDLDLTLDFFYLSSASIGASNDLVFVQSPARYPYAEVAATGVADFVVLPMPPPVLGTTPRSDVLACGPDGVQRIAWDQGILPVGGPVAGLVSASAGWAGAHGLCAAADPALPGGARILGIASDGQSLLVGELNGLDLVTSSVVPTSGAVLQAVLLDLDTTLPGLEMAYTTTAGLMVLSSAGVPLAPVVPPFDGVVGLSINPSGELLGDTLLYAVNQQSSQQLVYEIGSSGSGLTFANPVLTGPTLLSDFEVGRVNGGNYADLVLAASNTPDVFVLRQLAPDPAPVSGTDSFAMSLAPDFWRIDLSRVDRYGWAVDDFDVACGDFDNDDFDDVMVLDVTAGHAPRLLLHSGANEHHGETAPVLDPVENPPQSPPLANMVHLVHTVNVELLPRTQDRPSHLRIQAWERQGLTNPVTRAPRYTYDRVLPAGVTTLTLDEDIPLSNDPRLFSEYIQLTWVEIEDGEVVQSGTPSSWVGAVCEFRKWPVDCILCSEPDQYSGIVSCSPDPCDPPTICDLPDGSGAPLIRALSRRSDVGPFQL